jgi:predicted TIM-barrel fold metal-dependent hydrolase
VTRRVIFLDIDGVLAPIRRWDRYGALDPACIQVLNEIVARGGADVVVSSTWRYGKTVAELQEMLDAVGFTGRVVDKTPIGAPGASRGEEIATWLAEHAVGGYVIIDDHVVMGELRPRLVLTQPAHGLQSADAPRAIAALVRPTDRRTAMLIVDSQIHLWQNGKMSAQHRQIPTYSVDDALAEMASAGVDCAVIHPPSALGEAANLLAVEAVRRHPDKFCILGHFDLQSPDRETIVSRWRERPGMLGFRFTFNRPHQKAWWTDGSLDWFWAAAEKAGLPVGLLAGGKMAAVEKIAERHPRLTLHIDHLGRHGGGTAGTDDAAFADLRDMLALARFPNVAVKMSGAPSYSSHPYPYRNIHGYLRQIFEAFGPERCFWGTDITRMPCSYRQCVTMFTEELPWLGGRDLERVMGGAIVDWLGWNRPAVAWPVPS